MNRVGCRFKEARLKGTETMAQSDKTTTCKTPNLRLEWNMENDDIDLKKLIIAARETSDENAHAASSLRKRHDCLPVVSSRL